MIDHPPFGRAAIVHDWFQGFHGSERVVDVMREDVFGGQCDVLTFHAAKQLLPSPLAEAIVHESRVAALPGIRQEGHEPGRWRYLLPYMPFYFRRLDLGEYDVVISSSHANASAVRPPPETTHVCYCYTPMRYAWMPDLERARTSGVRGVALRATSGALRRLDYAASRGPDSYVAISEAIRDRIRQFYGRDAVVIHPPVETAEIRPSIDKDEGRFLWVHRLVPYKHPLVVAEAFRGLPYRLVMVGIGPLEERLRATLPPNVELRGWTERSELVRLYETSGGFIHVGEEDFGITMVEALAGGTPVIALNRGGARDIVRGGLDGVTVAAPEVELIRDAVRTIASRKWDTSELAARAQDFSRERFATRLAEHVAQVRDGR